MAQIIEGHGEAAIVTSSPATSAAQQHYIDWPAVLGGAVVAWALTFLFFTFASGIGLTMTSTPWNEGMSATWFLIAAAIWFIWTQVSSVMAGGYIAGRLRRRVNDATDHEVEVRDGVHGLLVWAVSALVGAALALGLAAGGVKTVSGVAASTTRVAESVLDDKGLDYVTDRLFRTAPLSDDVTSAPQQSETERAEVRRIIAAGGRSGTLSDVDSTYIAQTIARLTGLSAEEARTRVDGFLTVQLTEARAAIEKGRKIGVTVTFLTAATFLLSALAGWWAACMGGHHRDSNLNLARWFRIR